MQITELSEPVKRILFLAVIVVGVFSVIIMGFNFLAGANASSQPTATPTRTSTNSVKVSPLLFGTNLNISQKDQQSADQITSTQRQLQSMHVQIVRISLSEKPTQQEMTQQAQYIRQIGAIPLVSLHSSFYPQALTDDTLA